ncbi:MAG: transglutaminase domain-containing protein [Phycisphaerales bacterium]|nr:MAG: transglutaminase domain-containing protein [Phycisphaerales bacterium]
MSNTKTRSTRAGSLLGLAAMSALVGVALAPTLAFAQSSRSKDKARTTTPADQATTPDNTNQPSAPLKRPEPTFGPYIEPYGERDWILNVTIRINSELGGESTDLQDASGKHARVPKITPFPIKSVTMVWPIVPMSGTSMCDPESVTGEVAFQDRLQTRDVSIMKSLFHSGVKLAHWDVTLNEIANVREVDFNVTIPARAWNTRFDEEHALLVPWPKGAWPTDAALTFGSQAFVDLAPTNGKPDEYNKVVLRKFLDAALKNERIDNIKDVSVTLVAKAITKAVWEQIQPSGISTINRRGQTRELSGVFMNGPSHTILTERGTNEDITVLMAALFREAGIPTRTVIGWEFGTSRDRRYGKSSEGLRSWVEYCLYDEAANTVNWIPVDVVSLRGSSSRPMSIDKPWKKYFGSHDELQDVVPFAFQFYPPTDVVSYGSAAFWGWYVQPKFPGTAIQALRFSGGRAPNYGDERDDKPKSKSDN